MSHVELSRHKSASGTSQSAACASQVVALPVVSAVSLELRAIDATRRSMVAGQSEQMPRIQKCSAKQAMEPTQSQEPGLAGPVVDAIVVGDQEDLT